MSLYTHDCDQCKHLGTFLGIDVYICPKSDLGASIIGRYANDGPNYSSMPLKLFQRLIRENSGISIGKMDEQHPACVMPYCTYLASDYASTTDKAWMLALSASYLR